MKIRTILASKGRNVITARPEQLTKEAVVLLARYNIGALVVVDQSGRPIGIISERDIVREAARSTNALAEPISRVMTRGLVTGTAEDDVQAVLRTMTENRFRHLPILEDGELAGIVSIGDLVKAQLYEYQGQIDTLEMRVTGG
jgi:CBS domain-containing protein